MLIKPDFSQTPPYFQKYINLMPQQDLLTALVDNAKEMNAFYSKIDASKENFAFAENKWNIKQVLQHCVDVEKIFMYRALRCSRLDNTALAGFDENTFAQNDNSNNLNLTQILKDFNSTRASTIQFFENADAEKLLFMLHANTWQTNALQLGWVSAGHFVHHAGVVQEKYLM